MKHRLLIILLAALCAVASASGQTIRTLGFNTTNGQIVYSGTNTLTFTNNVNFGGGDLSISNQTIAGSGVSFSFEDAAFDYGATIVRESLGFSTNLNSLWTATNSSNARNAVGLGATWLTNTNVTNFRTAIGLGTTNDVTFGTVRPSLILWAAGEEVTASGWTSGEYSRSFNIETGLLSGAWSFDAAIDFAGTNTAANTRTNLSLGLQALTNTSNVTMMRALSGSTNTNHPYSGSISVVGTNNTNTLVFSNGILQSVQ